MATSFKAIIPFPAAVLALSALAACGGESGGGNEAATAPGAAPASNASAAAASQLFPHDFQGVCSGATVSRATAYDPAATTHKALYFGTYRDDFMDRSSSLPDDWTVQYSQTGNAYAAVDLVVCARRTAAQQVKVCDGYQNDGRPTQNKVRWHTATYELSVREATTGRELAKTTAEANSTTCPMFANFSSDSETIDDYAWLSESQVADFLRPHMTR